LYATREAKASFRVLEPDKATLPGSPAWDRVGFANPNQEPDEEESTKRLSKLYQSLSLLTQSRETRRGKIAPLQASVQKKRIQMEARALAYSTSC